MSRRVLSQAPDIECVPSGWTWINLASFANEITERAGNTPNLPVLSVTKHQGIVRAANYFKKAVHSRDTANYKVVRQGQFAYATIHLDEGSIGLLSEESAGMVSPMYTVFAVTGQIEPKFLLAALKSVDSLNEYRRLAEGTVNRRASVGFSRFGTLYLRLPPLPEQQKIAAILSSVDDAIESTQAVIDQLQVVKKAMMAELLTRGLPGRHTRFKQTEIGEVPEGWEVVRLDSVAAIQTGIAKGKNIKDGVELPYLRVANVQDGYVDLTEIKTITVPAQSVGRYSLSEGDVLFTEGGDADKLGRGCVWDVQIDPCLHQNHVFAVRTERNRLLPQFLAYWAASPRGKAYFLDCAKQTTNLASINSSQLKSMPVPVVPIDEQGLIVDVISAVDLRLRLEMAAISQLAELKSALTSTLLTGELRVKVTP